MTTAKMKEA